MRVFREDVSGKYDKVRLAEVDEIIAVDEYADDFDIGEYITIGENASIPCNLVKEVALMLFNRMYDNCLAVEKVFIPSEESGNEGAEFKLSYRMTAEGKIQIYGVYSYEDEIAEYTFVLTEEEENILSDAFDNFCKGITGCTVYELINADN